jgi:predicted acylesterase/phospholipase RssA
MKFPFFSKKKDRYVLVISWGWMRGFYGWGVFKAIDELWLRDRVDAIYWVSAWGLLASYWAAWYNADKIVELFLNSEFLDLSKDLNLLPKSSMLSNKMLKKQIERDLPETFEELKIPTYIWCTDTNEWQNVILSSWDLSSALMWTIAIPWIFPAIEREGMCLIDGWVTNNFPLAIAKNKFPHHKIIWISLNKYQKNQKIKNLFDNLLVSFEIMLRKDIEPQWALADVFFHKSLEIPVLEFNKTKLKKLYNLWYEDWLEKLKEIV